MKMVCDLHVRFHSTKNDESIDCSLDISIMRLIMVIELTAYGFFKWYLNMIVASCYRLGSLSNARFHHCSERLWFLAEFYLIVVIESTQKCFVQLQFAFLSHFHVVEYFQKLIGIVSGVTVMYVNVNHWVTRPNDIQLTQIPWNEIWLLPEGWRIDQNDSSRRNHFPADWWRLRSLLRNIRWLASSVRQSLCQRR